MTTGPKTAWTSVVEYRDIRYEHSGTGIALVTIDRPEVRNAFRPETVAELIDAFRRIRDDGSIGCVLLTGAGDKAFCGSRAEVATLATTDLLGSTSWICSARSARCQSR